MIKGKKKIEIVIYLLSAIVKLRVPSSCLGPLSRFVLIIHDHITHVMSLLSVHITDVYIRY